MYHCLYNVGSGGGASHRFVSSCCEERQECRSGRSCDAPGANVSPASEVLLIPDCRREAGLVSGSGDTSLPGDHDPANIVFPESQQQYPWLSRRMSGLSLPSELIEKNSRTNICAICLYSTSFIFFYKGRDLCTPHAITVLPEIQ